MPMPSAALSLSRMAIKARESGPYEVDSNPCQDDKADEDDVIEGAIPFTSSPKREARGNIMPLVLGEAFPWNEEILKNKLTCQSGNGQVEVFEADRWNPKYHAHKGSDYACRYNREPEGKMGLCCKNGAA